MSRSLAHFFLHVAVKVRREYGRFLLPVPIVNPEGGDDAPEVLKAKTPVW